LINKIKYYVKNIFFGLFVTITFYAIIELIIRIFLPFPLTSITTYKEDVEVMYFHKSNSKGYEISLVNEFSPIKLEYNKFGFRGESFPELKEKVFLIGDSYVEARQVNFSDTISELLNKKNDGVFYVNAGCYENWCFIIGS